MILERPKDPENKDALNTSMESMMGFAKGMQEPTEAFSVAKAGTLHPKGKIQ